MNSYVFVFDLPYVGKDYEYMNKYNVYKIDANTPKELCEIIKQNEKLVLTIIYSLIYYIDVNVNKDFVMPDVFYNIRKKYLCERDLFRHQIKHLKKSKLYESMLNEFKAIKYGLLYNEFRKYTITDFLECPNGLPLIFYENSFMDLTPEQKKDDDVEERIEYVKNMDVPKLMILM